MGLQPYVDNDFYIKESRDMITIVQSMIIAGNCRVRECCVSTSFHDYDCCYLFYNQARKALMTIASDSLFFPPLSTLAHASNSNIERRKKSRTDKVLRV